MSGYGGMSTSGSKNQGYSNANFQTSSELTPEQIQYLQTLWANARGAFDFASQQFQPRSMQAADQQTQLFNDTMPAYKNALVGGAFADFDPNRLTENIYSSMKGQGQNINEFERMQMNNQGLNKRANSIIDQRMNPGKKKKKSSPVLDEDRLPKRTPL